MEKQPTPAYVSSAASKTPSRAMGRHRPAPIILQRRGGVLRGPPPTAPRAPGLPWSSAWEEPVVMANGLGQARVTVAWCHRGTTGDRSL